MQSNGESTAELDARERRAARWSWAIVAMLFLIPTLVLLGGRVYLWILADTMTGMTVWQSVGWWLAGIPLAIVIALVWTWLERR